MQIWFALSNIITRKDASIPIWKKQFLEVIKEADKRCGPFVTVDTWKLAGLCNYVVQLWNKLKNMRP